MPPMFLIGSVNAVNSVCIKPILLGPFLCRIAYRDQGKGAESVANAQGSVGLVHAILVGSDGQPYAAQAELSNLQQNVLCCNRQVDLAQLREPQPIHFEAGNNHHWGIGCTTGLETALSQLLNDGGVAHHIELPGLLIACGGRCHGCAEDFFILLRLHGTRLVVFTLMDNVFPTYTVISTSLVSIIVPSTFIRYLGAESKAIRE